MAPNIAVRPLHRARPMSRGRRVLATSSILLGLLIAGQPSGEVAGPAARAPRLDTPVARPRPASDLRLNGDVDSNSPALWELVDGEPRLHVFTSTAGVTRRSEGSKVENLTLAEAVTWTIAPEQGVWMEAVVADDAGVWYGYYHNERRGIVCGKSRQGAAAHRRGAIARSRRHVGRPRDDSRSASRLAQVPTRRTTTFMAASAI